MDGVDGYDFVQLKDDVPTGSTPEKLPSEVLQAEIGSIRDQISRREKALHLDVEYLQYNYNNIYHNHYIY